MNKRIFVILPLTFIGIFSFYAYKTTTAPCASTSRQCMVTVCWFSKTFFPSKDLRVIPLKQCVLFYSGLTEYPIYYAILAFYDAGTYLRFSLYHFAPSCELSFFFALSDASFNVCRNRKRVWVLNSSQGFPIHKFVDFPLADRTTNLMRVGVALLKTVYIEG